MTRSQAGSGPPCVRLSVRAKPRASRSRIVKLEGLELEVALAAPPVDGAANAELLAVLSRALGLRASALCLRLGQTSKHKVVEVSGLSEAELRQRLEAAVAKGA